MAPTPVDLVKNRPAETAMPIATVIAYLIAKIVDIDDVDTIFYMSLVISFVPAAVTWTVVLLRKKSDDNRDP